MSSRCLRRLWPHVDLDATAITGSVAIECHLAARGLAPHRVVNDIDLVARSWSAVKPSVTSEFLVSHFHRPHDDYAKFLVQLVHPESGVRVDIFPAGLEALERSQFFDIDGLEVRALSVHDLLDQKLTLLNGATPDRRVDRKHLADAMVLGRMCGRVVGRCANEVLCDEEYLRDTSVKCARCDRSTHPAYTLASKDRIAAVLGYV